nr:hypothetical protein [Rhizobium bangladeshense]
MEYRIGDARRHLIWVTETGGGIWDEKGELLDLEGSIINIQSLYQRIDERTADMRVTASKTNEILQSLRYLSCSPSSRHRGGPCRHGRVRLCRACHRDAHARQLLGRGRTRHFQRASKPEG